MRDGALDLRDHYCDSIFFPAPSFVRICLGFSSCPFWDIFHVMFPLLFCFGYATSLNRYFPHVPHQRSNASVIVHSLWFHLNVSSTFYDRSITRTQARKAILLCYKLFVRAFLCCHRLSQALFPMSHLTDTAAKIAYL